MKIAPLVPLFAISHLLTGCSAHEPSSAPSDAMASPRPTTTARATASSAPSATSSAAAGAAVADGARALLGQPAPSFELSDLDGKRVRSSDHRGKILVLEWFNPDCPFVRQAHANAEQLRGLAKRLGGDDLVWLAINSAAPGKQGHGREANEQGRSRSAIDYPILLDESGVVGRAYGAERTPQIFIIDREGRLVYRGALDNTEGGDVEDTKPYVSYVREALADVRAGRAVQRAETKPYGCSVKYGR